MLKQNWRLVARFERMGDLLLVIICFFLSYYGRDSLVYWNDRLDWHLPFAGDELAPIKDYFLVLLVGAISYLSALQALGAYGSMRLVGAFGLIRISILSSVFVFEGGQGSFNFLLRQWPRESRSFDVCQCILIPYH